MSQPSPSTVTYYVVNETRELIEALCARLGLNMGQVSLAALRHYRGLIDAGEADKPEAARIGPASGQPSRRITSPGHSDIADWITEVSDT